MGGGSEGGGDATGRAGGDVTDGVGGKAAGGGGGGAADGERDMLAGVIIAESAKDVPAIWVGAVLNRRHASEAVGQKLKRLQAVRCWQAAQHASKSGALALLKRAMYPVFQSE